MENTQDWESLIAERTEAHGIVKTCLVEDPVKRNRRNIDRRYDKSPKRIAQHRAWAQSPAGKKSMHERGKRYRATEKGKLNSRKKSMAYYDRHKNDPEWKAHKRAMQKAWRDKNREQRQEYERERRARKLAEKKAKEAA